MFFFDPPDVGEEAHVESGEAEVAVVVVGEAGREGESGGVSAPSQDLDRSSSAHVLQTRNQPQTQPPPSLKKRTHYFSQK